MESDQEGLGDSLRVTIERSELTDAFIEAGDLSLERLTDVADGIPVLKWITAAGKTALSIRDYLFVRKLAAFLADLNALPSEDRANLIKRLDQEPAFSGRASEALITVLDRVDSTLKAKWLAKALAGLCHRADHGQRVDAAQRCGRTSACVRHRRDRSDP